MRLLSSIDDYTPEYPTEVYDGEMKELQSAYQSLKSRLLRSGTEGHLPWRRIVEQLDTESNIRRLAEQADKAARYLQTLLDYLEQNGAGTKVTESSARAS